VSRALGVLASQIGDYTRAEVRSAGDEGRAQGLLMQARSIAERIGQGAVVAEVVEIEKRDGI
jgi:hypothetical protein